ncbi:MAG TPA: hypothetical protein VJS37_04430 [Terriglobales bacterium]|nr:hypothetical protein [Terriglobales bacterium]
MRHRNAIRQLFLDRGRSYSITEAASLLGWPASRLRTELSSQYLISESSWETKPVPWCAVAVLALSEWSYLQIEQALGDAACTLPDLVRLKGAYIRLPRYQLAVIRAAAHRTHTSVDEFLARHFVELSCEEAPTLSAKLPGFREAFHWPSSL